MSLIYILLFIELILLCAAWVMTDGDMVSPSVVTILMFIMSTLFNIYAIDLWDNPTFHPATVIAVTLGLLAVMLAELAVILIYKRRKTVKPLEQSSVKEIVLEKWKLIFCVGVCVIFTALYYLNIRQIAAGMGMGVGSAISYIKTHYANEELQLNVIVRQGYKVITACAYIHLFLFINNCMVVRAGLRKNIAHLIPVGCLVLVCILSGGRLDIIRLMAAGLVFLEVLMNERRCWTKAARKKTNRKIIRIAVPLILILAVVLTQLRNITKGNITTNKLTNIVDYLAFYLGSSLQVLNLKIQKGIENFRLDYFGQLTFRGIWNFLSRYGFTEDYIKLNLSSYEYLIRRMGIGGNTDTMVGPPLFDFGYLGMFGLLFTQYFVIAKAYYHRIFGTQSGYRRNQRLMVYGFCFFIVLMGYYENCMYTIVSFTGLTSLVFLLAAYWFYFKCKIKFK